MTSRAPLVSVVLPTYDCEAYLPRAVESVLGQTFPDFELLVVDDGSTDGTPDLATGYRSDPRVHHLRHGRNRGPSAARNTGIAAARADLVTFLDADDFWEPDYLRAQVEVLGDPDADVACVDAYLSTDRGVEVVVKEPPFGGDALYEELLFRNTIPASSSGTVVRRRWLDRVGGFDEGLRAVEDRDLWIRLAAVCSFRFVPVPLATVERTRPESAVWDRLRMADGREAFLRKREADIPDRLRHLLPRLRRHTYLTVARFHHEVGDPAACRRYCLRAIRAHPRADAELRRALSTLARSVGLHPGKPASPAGV